jgi:glycosyltransferase involved in cell wall biosynthesis
MIERIVVINDISTPRGGATALALASVIAFREQGFPVTYIAGDDGRNPDLQDRGVEVVALNRQRLTSSGRMRAFTDGLYNRAARKMASDWITRNDTPGTVYHLHGWAQILSPSIFAALEPVRSRLVVSAHDFFLACPNGSFAHLKTGEVCDLKPLSAGCLVTNCDRRNYAQKLWRVARQAIHRTLFDPPNAPTILAIHERMRPFLVRSGIPSSAIEAVPNPVRPFRRDRVEAEANREFIFVGRLEETKGADLAAAAARRAGVPMRFIGDGVLRPGLERDYPEMTFTGHVPQHRIAELVGDARALVMPSRYPEPYGLVAAEALWSGIPVIVADTALLAPEIVAGGAGLACAPRDLDAFAAALRTMAADDGLIGDMSMAGYKGLATIGLAPQAWIERLLAAYGKVLPVER